MGTALMILGFSRDAIVVVAPLLERLAAEKRDPTPEEREQLLAWQKTEEDDFNSDLGG